MPPETATKPPVSFPFKGRADASWPLCSNCQGYGHITQELAIAKAQGLKGDPCPVCNGVGRVPDTSWPKCECAGDEESCPLCGGLGSLSPERQAAIDSGRLRIPCPDCKGAGTVPYGGTADGRGQSRRGADEPAGPDKPSAGAGAAVKAASSPAA